MATLTTLAQYHMDYGDHMDGGWGWGMFAVMVLLALAVIALVVSVVRTTATSRIHVPAGPGGETPMQILDRRLAAGEITPDEYRERAAVISRT